MKKILFLATVLGCLLFVFVQNGFSEYSILENKLMGPGQDYLPDEIVVKFKPWVSEGIIAKLNLRHRTSILYRSPLAGFKRLKIPGDKTVHEMVEILRKNPNVEYAEPNYIASAFLVPNDFYYRYQWHLDNPVYGGINMEEAWNMTAGDSSVIVAVLDTGVAYEDYTQTVSGRTYRYYRAPDLANTRFVAGYDFINNDAHPNDDNGHGTHVTGTIAQSTNNGTGVAGVAFNCSIMPVKVLDKSGSGSYTAIADGIRWAANGGAKVINLSLGGSSPSTTLENALAYAYQKGVTIVCAAGNDGKSTLRYPAAYDAYCIAVGATRYDETRASYSNYGDSLDLVAPGGDLNVDQNGDGYGDGVLQQTFSTTNNWGYWFYQGTSMAAPHVSGVAALLISAGRAGTPDEVRTALQSTAKDLGPPGFDPGYGWGRVDAYAALNYSPAIPNQPPVANAGGPYTGTEDSLVGFVGSGSYDPDGDILTYRWDFGDGTIGTGVNPTHTYNAGGSYTVTLVVNDGKTDSSPHTITITIEEVNDPPVADAGPDQTATVGSSVAFNGSGSSDPDGTIVSYAWNFGDGSTGTGTGVNPSHTYSASGTYTVTLTVTDNGGQADSDTCTVTVNAPTQNNPPVADAGPDQTATVGSSVAFNGSGSSDPDGTIASYAWNFGDGSTGLGAKPSHTYSALGTYGVTLTVTDNGGQPDSDTCTVTVNARPQNEEFTFTGTVKPLRENKHSVDIKSGAKSMEVRLTWNSLHDLRLRIYNPNGTRAAEVDKSTPQNMVEEITLQNPVSGVGRVAAYNESLILSIPYVIKVVVNY